LLLLLAESAAEATCFQVCCSAIVHEHYFLGHDISVLSGGILVKRGTLFTMWVGIAEKVLSEVKVTPTDGGPPWRGSGAYGLRGSCRFRFL